MLFKRTLLFCAVALMSAYCNSTVPFTASGQPSTGAESEQVFEVDPNAKRKGSSASEVQKFMNLVNLHRKKAGCSPLAENPVLMNVAQNHAEDMERRNYFSHRTPEGLSPFDRMKKAGIRYWTAAENIAQGQPTAEMVLKQWLASPGHRKNIENCKLKSHGTGLAEKSNTWVHAFATIRN